MAYYSHIISYYPLLPISLSKVVYLTNQVKMFQKRAAEEHYPERSALCVFEPA